MTVHLPGDLAHEFGAPAHHITTAENLNALLQELDRQYPGMANWIAEVNGSVRQHLSVFVDGRRLEPTAALTTSLAHAQEVWILRAVSGG